MVCKGAKKRKKGKGPGDVDALGTWDLDTVLANCWTDDALDAMLATFADADFDAMIAELGSWDVDAMLATFADADFDATIAELGSWDGCWHFGGGG